MVSPGAIVVAGQFELELIVVVNEPVAGLAGVGDFVPKSNDLIVCITCTNQMQVRGRFRWVDASHS